MSLDTKYRPMVYADVIGQEANVVVLRNIVAKGAGFHQSYVFCGPHGTGKTTLGRILARALLCENPLEGNPCDKCSSCLSILEYGSSECFVEVDAATNSGKADIKEILEQLEYTAVSGKKRIYLFDEAHELSRQALDGLLKPMEDTVYGTEDKKLICIFCTTEPEKMRKTIFSRCAPAFVVRSPTPKEIADRLQYICGIENINSAEDALIAIAEHCECHVRDAIKAVEGISMVGDIDMKGVQEYLRLDILNHCLDVLVNLRQDFPMVLTKLDLLSAISSPSACYEMLAKQAMLSFRFSMGLKKIPVYIQEERVASIAKKGGSLLQLVKSLLSPPHNPSFNMLICDLAQYHHNNHIQERIAPSMEVIREKPPQKKNTVVQDSVSSKTESKVVNGVYRESTAINKGSEQTAIPKRVQTGISVASFRSFLLTRIRELELEDGSKRRKNLGGFGTFGSR